MSFPEKTNWGPASSPLVQMRSQTDAEIPTEWLLSSLASYLVWAVFALLLWLAGSGSGANVTVGLGSLGLDFALPTLLGTLGIVGLAVSSLSAHLVYTLINRVNAHSARSQLLFSNALEEIESKAKGLTPQIFLPLSSSEESLSRLSTHHRDRSAILWGLLTVVPFLGWIFLVVILWLLEKEFTRHVRYETLVVEDVDRTLRMAGLPGVFVDNSTIRSHDLIGVSIIMISTVEFFSSIVLGLLGAFVLIYLTIGALSLFWIDLNMHGPIKHFSNHSRIEDLLANVLPDIATMNVGTG